MIRIALASLVMAVFAQAAMADGQIEFQMPSGNVGCIYTPQGGTDVYQTADGLAELQCDRVAPAYVRVVLGATGKPRKYTDAGDASCCSGKVLAYGKVFKAGPFSCLSAASGLTCTRGKRGFVMNRRGVKTY